MNILRESMTRIAVKNIVIRVWRQESMDTAPDNSDMIASIRELLEERQTLLKLAESIIKFERVAAVEVLDELGNGEILYRCEEMKIGGRTFQII